MHRHSLLLTAPRRLEWVQEHARWFFNFVREHPSNLEQLFDYHTAADKLIATFELLANGAIVPIKVLVRYNTGNPRDLESEG